MNTITKAVLLLFAFTFISCDKDFNTLGSDIVGDENFNFEKYTAENLNSYIKPAGAVQTNNLPINELGIYNNPVFGTTKAHFVSQIEMVNQNPNIGFNHFVDNRDSVYVYIPFYSTLKSTDANGARTFELDSIYGDEDAKFNLKVYENGYTLRDFDPSTNNQTAQKYYSDFKPTIDSYKIGQPLNNGPVSQNTGFFFDKNEIVIYKTNGNGQFYDSDGEITNDPTKFVVKERKLPGIWLSLERTAFKTKILDAVENGKLFNNNIFKEHFKGLYFEVTENVANQGQLAKLDFSQAELVVQYHYYSADNITDEALALKSSLSFQMGYAQSGTKKSNSINLLEFSNINPQYQSSLESSASQEIHYLKGGVNGSVVYIDLFNDSELAMLRDKNWLINEANLVFYVDQANMSPAKYEPQRAYLFDATNDRPLSDYYGDASASTNIKFNKFIYGGILEKSSDGKGFRYKFRITNYINNVLNGTNPNTNGNSRLGLVVTESIGVVSNAYFKNPFLIGSDEIEFLPVAAVMNPLGTILHGTQSTDVTKKLKLEIYYTEPN
jgi:hypothetical protein